MLQNGGQRRGFIQPAEPLAQSLENVRGKRTKKKKKRPNYQDTDETVAEEAKEASVKETSLAKDSTKGSASKDKDGGRDKEKASSGSASAQETTVQDDSKDKVKDTVEATEAKAQDNPKTEEKLNETDKKEQEEKLEGATADTDETKLEAAKEDEQVLSEEQLQQQLREDSASPDLLDIDTHSECSFATTEQDGEGE